MILPHSCLISLPHKALSWSCLVNHLIILFQNPHLCLITSHFPVSWYCLLPPSLYEVPSSFSHLIIPSPHNLVSVSWFCLMAFSADSFMTLFHVCLTTVLITVSKPFHNRVSSDRLITLPHNPVSPYCLSHCLKHCFIGLFHNPIS